VVFAGGLVFGAEVSGGLVEHGESPTAIEDLFGIRFGDRFNLVTLFSFEFIQGNEGPAPTTFLGMGAGPFMGQEMLHDTEEPGTKAALGGISSVEQPPGEKLSEKFLGEFFGGFGIITAATDISVQRIPIGAAEVFEGMIGLGGKRISGVADHAPVGGGEPLLFGRRRASLGLGVHYGGMIAG